MLSKPIDRSLTFALERGLFDPLPVWFFVDSAKTAELGQLFRNFAE